MISKLMIRQPRSPTMRAESTKSRFLSDSVWTRSTRAPHAQPVTLMISPISRSLGSASLGRNPVITMSRGRAGSTSPMLISMENRSSMRPPTYPEVTPMITDSAVATRPARKATSIVLRPPTRS